MEQFELKHIEFIRCIKYFDTMSSVWSNLGLKTPDASESSFAKRQSSTYLTLRDDASKWFFKVAAPRFRSMTENNMIQMVIDFRHEELAWMGEYVLASR